MPMRAVSLFTKTHLVALLFSLATSGAVGISFWRLNLRQSASVAATEAARSRLHLISETRAQQMRLAIHLRDLILTPEAGDMEKLVRTMTEEKANLDRGLETLLSSANEAERETVIAYKNLLAEWWMKNVEIQSLALDRKTIDANYASKSQATPRYLTLDTALETLSWTDEKQLRDIVQQAASDVAAAPTEVFLSILASLLLAATVTVVVVRHSSRQTKAAILTVHSSNDQLVSMSQKTKASLQQFMQTILEQRSSIIAAAAAANATVATATTTTDQALNTANWSSIALQGVENGKIVAAQLRTAMEEVHHQSTQLGTHILQANVDVLGITKVIGTISDKMRVINDIVFQTKLLSFNASVEAARAGEHGEGFAVVADDIARLAELSGSAAKDLSLLVEESRAKVELIVDGTRSKLSGFLAAERLSIASGCDLARVCSDRLQEISESAKSVAQLSAELAQTSKAHTMTVATLTRSMQQLRVETQRQAQAGSIVTQGVQELTKQGKNLRHATQALARIILGGLPPRRVTNLSTENGRPGKSPAITPIAAPVGTSPGGPEISSDQSRFAA